MPIDRPTLYGQALLDHARHPRWTRPLEPRASVRSVELDNPLCGDRVRLEVDATDPLHLRLAHSTRGCALCVASASFMAEALVGQPVATARSMASQVSSELEDHSDVLVPEPLLPIFGELHTAPMRRSCVQLPWSALERALNT